MASLIREAVDRYLAEDQDTPIFPADDPLFDLIGIAESDTVDASVNHDKYLYETPHNE